MLPRVFAAAHAPPRSNRHICTAEHSLRDCHEPSAGLLELEDLGRPHQPTHQSLHRQVLNLLSPLSLLYKLRPHHHFLTCSDLYKFISINNHLVNRVINLMALTNTSIVPYEPPTPIIFSDICLITLALLIESSTSWLPKLSTHTNL